MSEPFFYILVVETRRPYDLHAVLPFFLVVMPPAATNELVQTAGAVANLAQTPLPNSIVGTVFEDTNLNNSQQSGEPGIANATVETVKRRMGLYTAS